MTRKFLLLPAVLGFVAASLLIWHFFAANQTQQAPEVLPDVSSAESINFVNSVPLAHSEVYDLAGIISGPSQPTDSPAPDLTERYQQIGVTSVRNNDYFDDRLDIEGIFNCGGSTYPSWEGCDATQDRFYDWDASDALVQTISDGGFDLFLRLGGEWENANPHHDFKGPQNARQVANWIVAANKVADRYATSGEYLNIWTEYPGTQFWDGTAAEFNDFFVKAYQEIKARHSDMQVGGPGFGAGISVSVGEGRLPSAALTFLDGLYHSHVRPDWIGWHLFSSDPAEYGAVGSAWRDVLDGSGEFTDVPWAGTGFFNGVELICDAYGLATTQMENGEMKSLTANEADRLHNGGQGAALQTAAWIALQSTDTTRAYYYRGGDPKSSPSGKGVRSGNVGLFYGDAQATPKPSAFAFELRTRLARSYANLESVLTPSETGISGIWALSASSKNEGSAMLFANTSESNAVLSAEFDNGTAYLVDDTRDGTKGAPISGSAFDLPGMSALLVIIN
ncbi:hypothetical protein A2348_02910 [Candidatus Uhrbacteria bacterium RIFOXYB12_FULL_58_10]|uniref:Beta-xylosidase n=1 Tax=Candidatus Uhrbacteria bacterium RIFOXYB2_FULL_57_15 TaxID=1802422 RepID=A0A1F7W6N9_9BACT|nr:MAG: hypothetical protein A2348_02910 [Candidatus Uhrbacteria bacterium RIFOXYB12_FULL_58_10]OGL98440.1 MAG: hypothetical protein A2304_01980 [Candidatus Uhrbacteria bacterium RIFOXYB2_FULL_57_15]OGL99245.1 MAG: hypothetical protein A2501_03555 [Candidatus Uhrbacteria bacterium RIFOXYC12_FULL_57_11]